MNNVHFAIPEIYGETLSYYELLRNLVNKTNELIDNYNTVPEQIAEEVKNLDASQLFSAVLNQLIHSIAEDNTKSNNAVKVYKKHDLLYATFNETVNLYESLIDFTTGTETELIVGTNIREVNISELFIELRKLIGINKNNIDAVTAVANENSAEITTLHNDITNIENKNTEQDNEISTLRTMISTPYNFKGDVASISALPASGAVNDTYYVQDVKYKVTWTGSAWVQSSLSEADYQTELSELKSDLGDKQNLNTDTKTNIVNAINELNNRFISPVSESVANWLDEHPEATTTVQDYSLTVNKMVIGTLGYVTPEMFGAVGDGVNDDTNALVQCFKYENVFLSRNYVITEPIVIYSKRIIGLDSKLLFNSYNNITLLKFINTIIIDGINFDFNNSYVKEGLRFTNKAIVHNCNFNNVKDKDNTYASFIIITNKEISVDGCQFNNIYKLGNGEITDSGGAINCIYIADDDGFIKANINNCSFNEVHNINSSGQIIYEDTACIYIVSDNETSTKSDITITNINGNNFGKRLIKLMCSYAKINNIKCYTDTNDSLSCIGIIGGNSKKNSISNIECIGTIQAAICLDCNDSVLNNVVCDLVDNTLTEVSDSCGMYLCGRNLTINNINIKSSIGIEITENLAENVCINGGIIETNKYGIYSLAFRRNINGLSVKNISFKLLSGPCIMGANNANIVLAKNIIFSDCDILDMNTTAKGNIVNIGGFADVKISSITIVKENYGYDNMLYLSNCNNVSVNNISVNSGESNYVVRIDNSNNIDIANISILNSSFSALCELNTCAHVNSFLLNTNKINFIACNNCTAFVQVIDNIGKLPRNDRSFNGETFYILDTKKYVRFNGSSYVDV